MTADKYEDTVTQVRVTKTQNSYGEDVLTSTNLGTHSANVRPLTGREVEIYGQKFAEAQFVIEMDPKRCGLFEGDIRREDNFTWGSYTLNVLDAELSNPRRGEWRIITRVVVN